MIMATYIRTADQTLTGVPQVVHAGIPTQESSNHISIIWLVVGVVLTMSIFWRKKQETILLEKMSLEDAQAWMAKQAASRRIGLWIGLAAGMIVFAVALWFSFGVSPKSLHGEGGIKSSITTPHKP